MAAEWSGKKKGDPIPCGIAGTIKEVSSTGFWRMDETPLTLYLSDVSWMII